jgi:hypothetical protein
MQSSMNRILRAMTVVLLFEMGALLLYLPWSAFWEQNYFLHRFPWLIPIVLHPSMRGIVSGIGVLDIFVAFGLFNPRPAPVPPGSNS